MRQRATTRAGMWGAAVLGLSITASGAALASGDARMRPGTATPTASSKGGHAMRRSPMSVKTTRPPSATRRRQGSEAPHLGAAPGSEAPRTAAAPGSEAPRKAAAPERAPVTERSRQGAPADARKGHGRDARIAREPRPAKVPCLHEPVGVERGFGGDVQPIALTRCDGTSAPLALEQLSIVVRPMNAPRPTLPTTPVRQITHEREWLPGVKLIHEGLITRLQSVVDHFHAKKVTIVSGYRPASLGSFHQSARAMDLHVDGVSNEALVAYCRSLPDTGCGYYPNSSFVHLDVRAPRSGHVYWIDASGPGEAARYVATWPLRDTPGRSEIARPDPAAPADEHTHNDGITRIGYLPDAKVDARTTVPVDTQEDPFTP